MVPSTTDAAIPRTPSRRRRGRLTRGLKVLGVVLAIWLVMGFVRAEAVARDYFTRVHEGQTLTRVETQLLPAIPPFWTVSISGNVVEPGGLKGAGYVSAMILWVEPITGWVVLMGAG